jgi:DNA-binding LacI/PurR family transcriptional regulator
MNAPQPKPQTSPTVRHVAQQIEERIRTGLYPSARRLPSERSLADEFGVSRVIVRAAVDEIADRGLITRSANCRPLVLAPEAPAATLEKPSVRRNLALWIWPHPSDLAAAMIIRGVRQTLHEDDFRLFLESAHGDIWEEILRSEERFLKRLAYERDVEGVLLWYLGGPINLPALEGLREAGIPMVFLDRRPPDGLDADFVGVDNVRAAEALTRHLISLGHRRIAHVTNYDTRASTVAERGEGYQRALVKARMSFSEELIVRDPGSSEEDPSDLRDDFVDALLALPDPPTAFFAVNDVVAERLIKSLRARGLDVPGDAAVAGFDGNERTTEGSPFLTTMLQPFERIGAQAMELLLERIAAGPSAPFKHVILEPTLSVGRSTRGFDTAAISRKSSRKEMH